jgi:glycosyltransferase involved in cell wall biosynthesis
VVPMATIPDVEALPEAVDVICCDGVLEGVSDPVGLINRCYPLLRGGGCFVVRAASIRRAYVRREPKVPDTVLRSVLKTMQPRYTGGDWSCTVWHKVPIPATECPPSAGGEPLRLTFLLPTVAPWGGTRQMLALAAGLAGRGHVVHIIAPGERPKDLDARVAFHPVQQRLEPAAVPPSDIVIGTWHRNVAVAVAAAARFENAVSIHVSNGYEGAFPEHARHRRGIERAYRLPSLKVTPCASVVCELQLRFGQEPAYLPQSIASRESRAGTRRFAEDGCIWILIVGPFHAPVKGIATALRAVAAVRRVRSDVRLRRVSRSPLTAEEEAVQRPDEYHVMVDAARMAELMRASDIFVSACGEGEGFGLPAVEALHSGLPCVLARVSSHLTLSIDRQDYAVFAAPGDVPEFAAAIARVIADDELRQRLTRRAVEVATPYFDEQVALERWERYLGAVKRLAFQLAPLQRLALAPDHDGPGAGGVAWQPVGSSTHHGI